MKSFPPLTTAPNGPPRGSCRSRDWIVRRRQRMSLAELKEHHQTVDAGVEEGVFLGASNRVRCSSLLLCLVAEAVEIPQDHLTGRS